MGPAYAPPPLPTARRPRSRHPNVAALASALVSRSRLPRVEPERAADILPRRPVDNRGARQSPGDLVKLIDRGPNLGKRADALIGRASLGIDRSNGPTTPARQLRLDEAGEVG